VQSDDDDKADAAFLTVLVPVQGGGSVRLNQSPDLRAESTV